MKLILQIFALLTLTTTFIQCHSLIVATVLEEPMTMLRETTEANLTSNDRYEGFIVDLLHELSRMIGFDYILQVSATNTYGSRNNSTKKWNGLIGDLIDIVTGSMTITSEREEVVDFTQPFMFVGISILYKKGVIHEPSTGTYFAWLLIPLGHCVTDVFLLLTFMVGIILLLLRSKYKTILFRTLLGFWLLFLFLFASLFIAQLSSHYVLHSFMHEVTIDFHTAQELATQSQVVYGCIEGGSTESFFKNSLFPLYSKMWSKMKSMHPTTFVRNSQEGIDRVRKGGYAFLAESSTIEYAISRYCELAQVGGLLDSKGFGLAFRQGSVIRETFTEAILVLQQRGTLTQLKRRWWLERRGAGVCG